jgi:transposase-like protein
MASRERPNRVPAQRFRSVAEKRRIVELSLRGGASISEIARAHGIHYNSLSHWRSLYRAGKLTLGSPQVPRSPATVSSAALLPVTITPAVRSGRSAATVAPASRGRESSIVQLTLPSGTMLRLEVIGELDTEFVCALLAEVR